MGYRITMIGSGNLASHLAPALENAGHFVSEVYSRNQAAAKGLCSHLYDARHVNSPDFSQSKSAIFIIAVSDDAIEDVSSQIILPPDSILVHTSGTKSISLLSGFEQYGSFYPLQTFTKKKKISWEEVPILVEGSSQETTKHLLALARSISAKAFQAPEEKRKLIHLSAVYSANFANHLLYMAKSLLDEKDIDFTILKPLLSETLTKAFEIDPIKAQTGPAVRRDISTIREHLKILDNKEDFKKIYKDITENIIKVHSQS
jgi:predicted short-subunit dehydrogenase-like oxidoreductase (DUF2520 family)